jgi:hypothetical protein
MLSNNIESLSDKYLLLIINYNNFFFKNIDLYKNKDFLQNLYLKGLTIIQNIFNISLMHLENISDIYNLCEKGYIYFIEFINQINLSNCIENNFELTIKDAIIFCYKKTILLFENKIINNSNDSDDTKKLNKIIFTHIILINNLFILVNLNLYNSVNEYINYNNKINNQEILINNVVNILNENNKKINKIIKKTIENMNFKCLLTQNYDVIIYSLKNLANLIIELNNKISINNNFDSNLFLIILDKYLTKNKLIFNNEKLINHENFQIFIKLLSNNQCNNQSNNQSKNNIKILNSLLDNIYL